MIALRPALVLIINQDSGPFGTSSSFLIYTKIYTLVVQVGLGRLLGRLEFKSWANMKEPILHELFFPSVVHKECKAIAHRIWRPYPYYS